MLSLSRTASDVWNEEGESLSSVDSDNVGDENNVSLHANLPYQDVPLAVPSQPPAFEFEEVPYRIYTTFQVLGKRVKSD